MRNTCKVMNLAAFVIFCFVYGVESSNVTEDKIVLVAPVLSNSPSNSRARVTETAKDFPVITLLATDDDGTQDDEPKTDEQLQPIYVKKLTDLRRRRSVPRFILA